MQKKSPLTKLYVKTLPSDQPPYHVDEDTYQRFDQRNSLTIGRPNWDESVQVFSRKSVDTRVKKIKGGRPGYQVEDYSLFLAGGVTTFRMGNSINYSNRGVTPVKSLGNKFPQGIDQWEGTAQKATGLVIRVARYFGTDMVGIAPLDQRWSFSHAFWANGSHKEIVFQPAEAAEETDDQLIIPLYEPRIRISKVITDLPSERGKSIRFSVTGLCEVCQKCAEDCPVSAIPTGELIWERPNISNNPGVYTWHLDNETCRRYWSLGNGSNCTTCICSCPFTKHPGFVHDLTHTFISNAPVLNPLWRRLDDNFGYGHQGDATRFWSA